MFPSALAYCLLCKQIHFRSSKQNYSENCFTFSPSWLDCVFWSHGCRLLLLVNTWHRSREWTRMQGGTAVPWAFQGLAVRTWAAGYWDGPSSGHPPWGQRQGWINTINLQVCVFFFPIAEYFCFLLFISIRTLKLCFNSEKNMHLYFDLLTSNYKCTVIS